MFFRGFPTCSQHCISSNNNNNNNSIRRRSLRRVSHQHFFDCTSCKNAISFCTYKNDSIYANRIDANKTTSYTSIHAFNKTNNTMKMKHKHSIPFSPIFWAGFSDLYISPATTHRKESQPEFPSIIQSLISAEAILLFILYWIPLRQTKAKSKYIILSI